MRVFGLDVSLNHGGIVELTEGELSAIWYYTDIASSADKSPFGRRLVLPKIKDRQRLSVFRIDWVEEYLASIIQARRPDFAGIEDYAFEQAQGAHWLGEVGGIARILCYRAGVRFRLHDPTSVKSFAAEDGGANKSDVELAVQRKWGVDFSQYNPPPHKHTGRVNRCTSEDLSDAYTLARMVLTEVRLRSGELLLRDVTSEKERRIFLRVTKTYPVNVLDREWIYRGPENLSEVDG